MASLGGSMSSSRRFAPRLFKDLFTCRQCLRSQNNATKSPFRRQFAGLSFARTGRRDNPTILNSQTKQLFSHNLRKSAWSSTVANGAQEGGGATKGKSSFPQVSDKSVAYWLLGSAVSVFGIVVFGGLTRLTESGCVNLPIGIVGNIMNIIWMEVLITAVAQIEHHRMASRYRIPPSHER